MIGASVGGLEAVRKLDAGPRISATYEDEAAGLDVHTETLRRLLSENQGLVVKEMGPSEESARNTLKKAG